MPSFQPSQGLRIVLVVTGLLFKGKVNYKSLWGVLGSGDLRSTAHSYEELQPTKMTAPGGPVQSEGSGKGRQGTGTFCVWQQQRRSRSTAATQLSGSYSTLSWTQLGWAVPPIPQGAGGTQSCPKGLGWTWFRDFQSTDALQGPSEGPSTQC